MTPSMALFTYINVWAIMLLAMMPVGRAKGWSVRRLLLNETLLAAGITFAIHLLLLSGWIPLRNG